MNPADILDFKRSTEEYLEKHKIFNLFQELIEGLIVQKPKDPINHLMSRITEQDVFSFFFVAPPGSGAGEVIASIAAEKGGSF